jgi:hypothetical protein
MNKINLKIISKLSDQLPLQLYNSKYRVKISGEDVILSGQTKIEGNEIDLKKEYILNNVLQREVDHKQRMKKAYNKRGKAGLITYLKPFCKKEKFGSVQVFIMNNMC